VLCVVRAVRVCVFMMCVDVGVVALCVVAWCCCCVVLLVLLFVVFVVLLLAVCCCCCRGRCACASA